MRSSAAAGMVFLPSRELCQTVKPMTEIELNKKIENLLTESAPRQPSRRTGSAYRREMRIRKNDALMRIVTRRYVPHAGYIDYGFDGDTLLHSGKYIKYPKNSNCQRWMKRETSRKFRNCQDPVSYTHLLCFDFRYLLCRCAHNPYACIAHTVKKRVKLDVYKRQTFANP